MDIKNLFLILFSIIIILPSTYFLYKWGGIVPPSPGSQVRIQNINLNNVPLIFNIILIYVLPFVFFNFRSNYAKINKKQFFLIFAAFFIFLFLFYKFEPNQFAGGALNKLFYLFLPNEFIKFITINLSANTDVIISASLVSIFGSLYILTSGNIDTELLLLTISKFATRDL